MVKLPANTTKYYALQMFKLMMQRGKYEATYTTSCGTVLECAFDNDAWGVTVSYVTSDMLPVSAFHKVQKNWN